MPIALFTSGIIAWWAIKHPRPTKDDTWQDTSLDDWRRERDARAQADRDARENDEQ